MRRLAAALAAVVLAFGLFGVASAHNDGKNHKNGFKAGLDGWHEVPAISTTGRGTVRLSVNAANTQIEFTVSWTGLQGGSAGAAHIHLGQPDVLGGVAAFFCGGGGKPACPAGNATVTGTIAAADVLALPGQGLAAGDLNALLRALRAGVTYANVHTAGFPNGEIRGQIRH
jgi:hypothetical protein